MGKITLSNKLEKQPKIIQKFYLKLIQIDKLTEIQKTLKFTQENQKIINSRISLIVLSSLLKNILDFKDLQGDIIEIGSYQCGTTIAMAKFLEYAKIDKKIYSCDTYSGFPFSEDESPKSMIKSEMFLDNNLDDVKNKIKKYGVEDKIELVVGSFEDTLPKLNEKNYSMSFVDCDLSKSCKVALEHLKNRMVKGGFIFVHDYGSSNWGIKKAIDEYGVAIIIIWCGHKRLLVNI